MEMITENFISNLTAKFRSKNDDENNVFYSDLTSFVDACKYDSLQDIYNQITRDHTYSTIPRMGKFWKIAEKGKYLKAKEVKHNPIWYVCTNCKAEYSKEGRGCPKCRCTQASLSTGEHLPPGLIEVQEDCFYCDIYSESIKKENERKMYFTGCQDFGIKHTPQCYACVCKECCRQMIQYNADPKGTTEQYKSTKLAQPWVKEVQPLNQTVKEMVEDMKKRQFRK